jgi:hypothetical protein
LIDLQQSSNYLHRHQRKAGGAAMSSDTRTKTTLRYGLSAVAALALSIVLGGWNVSSVRAQSDDGTNAAAAPAQAAPQDESAAIDAQNEKNQAVQEAHDAADAAEQELDSATQARDQLESDGASQDQIDAANDAIAQARAAKDAANDAAQKADDAASK